MKTVIEWIGEVEQPHKAKIEANMNKPGCSYTKYYDKQVSDVWEALPYVFSWESSNEGSNYWHSIYSAKNWNFAAIIDKYEKKFSDLKFDNRAEHNYAVRFNSEKNLNQCSVLYNINTFANCQSFTIGLMCTILEHLEPDSVKYLIYRMGITANKRSAIIDINDAYVSRLKKVFNQKEDIILEAPYISTNKSRMTLLIIKVPQLTDIAKIKV